MITTAKTAIVTGASRGIGAAIAQHLAAAGYAVVINYHTHSQEAELVRAEIMEHGGNALTFCADLSCEAEAKALVDFTVERLGRLDVLVNNAGIAAGGSLAEIDAAHIHTLTSINIAGLLFVSKHAAAAFGDGGGAIVNISSVNGISPIPGAAVYSATKAAVNAITVSLARELGPRNIRVNAVAPGLTMTARYEAEVPDDAKRHIIKETPLGRLGVPDDLVGIVAFLASDGAGWITGQVITASGGAV